MKIIEIFESRERHYSTDISHHDSQFNPEINYYSQLERERAAKLKKSASGGTPLITKDSNHQDKWDVNPIKDEMQSPGFRGAQQLKKIGKLSHKKFQNPDPNAIKMPVEDSSLTPRTY